jgi:hypothetical protein
MITASFGSFRLYIEKIGLEPKFTSDAFGSNGGLLAHEQPQDV